MPGVPRPVSITPVAVPIPQITHKSREPEKEQNGHLQHPILQRQASKRWIKEDTAHKKL